jgi:hypothetical protein
MNLDLNEMMMNDEVVSEKIDLALPDVVRDGVAYIWCPRSQNWKCLGWLE